MLEVFLDALKDTALLIPFLLAVHLLIGFFEARGKGRIKKNGVLSSPLAPLVGTGLALLPQCGFSVVASELYARRLVSAGTLVAVFIATSDEAIPILIGEAASDPSLWARTGLLIGIKAAMALVAGYALLGMGAASGKRRARAENQCSVRTHEENRGGADGGCARAESASREDEDGFVHAHGHGCCGHEIGEEKGGVFERYFKHPLIHTLIITLFAFAVNFVLGTVIYIVTPDRFTALMRSGLYVQPLVATLVGLIPNCAASVMITELFANGSLSLGAAVSGLAVNAGLGIAVLVKENRRAGENALIVGGLIVYALAVGYVLTPFG